MAWRTPAIRTLAVLGTSLASEATQKSRAMCRPESVSSTCQRRCDVSTGIAPESTRNSVKARRVRQVRVVARQEGPREAWTVPVELLGRTGWFGGGDTYHVGHYLWLLARSVETLLVPFGHNEESILAWLLGRGRSDRSPYHPSGWTCRRCRSGFPRSGRSPRSRTPIPEASLVRPRSPPTAARGWRRLSPGPATADPRGPRRRSWPPCAVVQPSTPPEEHFGPEPLPTPRSGTGRPRGWCCRA